MNLPDGTKNNSNPPPTWFVVMFLLVLGSIAVLFVAIMFALAAKIVQAAF